MFRYIAALILLASLRPAIAKTAAELGDEIQRLSLDPAECYRVLDLNFNKEDLKVYLGSGYLVFAKPIASQQGPATRLAAVFVANAEGGDADVLLLPPTRSERASLATFTNTPNLEEHFKSAAFVFTDGTGDALLAEIQNNAASKKNLEMGGLIAERWNTTLNNLISSFETRVVYDVLSGQRETGMFYAAVAGNQLDNFDVLYDPTAGDQIIVGKLGFRNNRTYFDTWTAFPARSFRNGAVPKGILQCTFDKIRIDASIQTDLTMQAITRGTLTLQQTQSRSVIPFNLSPNMRITSASIDGHAAEVFDRASLRSNLIHGNEDRQFLLVSQTPLNPAVPHEIEIHHEGEVIRDSGNQVYYVGSRGTWYPRTGTGLANYDLAFKYPKNLTVAATGTRVDDHVDEEWRYTHLKTETPVRFAGFNLGDFQSVTREHNGYNIELYANVRLESALAPRANLPDMPPPENPFSRHHKRADPLAPSAVREPPNPAGRMDELTKNLLDALDFMTEQFGPNPIRRLAITPIPGSFGQGFPGLVYLSTLAYINPGQLPPRLRERVEEAFYSELLETHEVAHQWWGNMVVPASYHDDWLIESLANYSALLLLERRKGIKALDDVLDEYRTDLLAKTGSGRTIESAGPIVWGLRLESSLAPDAWRTVTYEKGTWIIHMLRRRLGDDKFMALLREVATHHSISTEEFRTLASKYAPKSPDGDLKIFFDNWVYGTGVPAIKLSYAWHGAKLAGSIAQRDVNDDFTAYVPVEVQTGTKSSVYWLPTSSDGATFSLAMKSPPTKVSLLTADCLMTTPK